MRFTVAAASAALVAGVSANYANVSAIYTTQVVTAYTTYCPEPTSIVHGDMTYTVTEATTLTITNCPCTVTMPVYTSSAVSCPNCPVSSPAPMSSAAPVPTSSSVAAPLPMSSAPAAPMYMNSTSPAGPATTPGVASPTVAPSGSPVSTTAAATFTGAANKAFVASGAGLAGLLGLAAYIL